MMHTPWELFGVETNRGWEWIVVALLQAALDEGATPTQVKEKYGGLRFYYYGGSEKLDQLVELAEQLAEKTCEVCGAPGRNRGQFWYTTLCDKHAEGYNG